MPSEWTVMLYAAAAQNLGEAARDALLQMKEIGSNSKLKIIAQFDTGSERTPTKRYLLSKLDNAREINESLRDIDFLESEQFKKRFRDVLNGSGDVETTFTNLQKLEINAVVRRSDNGGRAIEKRPLGSVFERLGDEPRRHFRDHILNNPKLREKLAEGPEFCLRPFILDCVLASDVVPDGGVVGSTATGDPLVLKRFIKWGLEKFPSKHKMIIIMGHGDGVSVAWDATPGQDPEEVDHLRGVELFEAFSIPRKGEPGCFEVFDIVGFDACAMGMVEVFYRLSNLVMIGIASEGPTPTQSWPYSKILPVLERHPDMESEPLANTILKKFMEDRKPFEKTCLDNEAIPNKNNCSIDLSVCNLLKVPDLVERLGRLAELLEKLADGKDVEPLLGARKDSQSYSSGDYVDLTHFCERLLENYPAEKFPKDDFVELREACSDVKNAIKGLVIASDKGTQSPKSHGLSIYFPEKEQALPPDNKKKNLLLTYSRSLQIREICWSKFLHSYVKLKKQQEKARGATA